jgi:hypothetical protein
MSEADLLKILTHSGDREGAVINAMVMMLGSDVYERLPAFLQKHQFKTQEEVWVSGWRSGYETALLALESGELQYIPNQEGVSKN